MTDERMEMLLKESFVNIRPGAELQEKLLQRLYAQEQVLTGRQQGNRYNLRRRVLTTACVLAALLVTGCAAMEIVKHYHATEMWEIRRIINRPHRIWEKLSEQWKPFPMDLTFRVLPW